MFGGLRKDRCAVHILYFEFSTDPGLLKIRHSHRFVVAVLPILIPLVLYTCFCGLPLFLFSVVVVVVAFSASLLLLRLL